MKVQVVRAWSRRFETVDLELPDGARVQDALIAAGWTQDPEAVACAVFGQRVEPATALHEGDRVELLRPLQADPKLARRQRVETRRQQERR
jgi:putative ubiquitin-RnfH superfamily antitoxin RatB of RatAB toxin-antitoxin module